MASNSKLYDYIRIDHFIGVVNYYSIKADCNNAKEGVWREGPGKKLTDAIDSAIGDAKIIAEDLGVVSPAVRELLAKTGYPGMNIIEFAFDGSPDNSHLPHNPHQGLLSAYCEEVSGRLRLSRALKARR